MQQDTTSSHNSTKPVVVGIPKRSIAVRAWDKGLKKYKYPDLWDSSMPSNWRSWYELEWFVGITDSKEELVYEGDLVTSDIVHLFNDRDIEKKPCVVVFDERLACYSFRLGKQQIPISEMINGWKSSVFTVIGNIRQNLELLG